MKKFLVFLVSLVLVIPFFICNSVPVHAETDTDYHYIDSNSVLAYSYFNNIGFGLESTLTTVSTETTAAITLNYGGTNYSMQCRASGSNYVCGVYNAAGTYMGSDFTIVPAHNTTITEYTKLDNRISWMENVSYTRPSAYSATGVVAIRNDRPYYVSFISNTLITANQIGWYSRGNDGYLEIKRLPLQTAGGNYLMTFTFQQVGTTAYGDYNNYNIDWPFTTNTHVVPIFVGYESSMTDEMKQTIGLPTAAESYLESMSTSLLAIQESFNQNTLAVQRTNSLMESGNSNTQTAQSNLAASNNELGHSVNDMNSIETTYNDDLNDALENIDLSQDLVQHTGFTNAALWVGNQFNRLVIGTPFELVIMFSLVTGLALVLIGKLRS